MPKAIVRAKGWSTKGKILLITLGLLLASNLFLVYEIVKSNQQKVYTEFNLLSPQVARMDIEDTEKFYKINYLDMKSEVNTTLSYQKNVRYGFYFEDLNSGAWIGINEKDLFIPASLLKIPVASAVLNNVQNGELSLEDEITLQKTDINTDFGVLSEQDIGKNYTVFELINMTLYYSDNSADTALGGLIDEGDFREALIHMGLSHNNYYGYKETVMISPKAYSNILRSLYYSGFLKRKYSQMILSLLTQTSLNAGIPAGIPPNIKVAHKVGIFRSEGMHRHDCGIVYHEERPYILCIMTQGLNQEDFDRLARNISSTVYYYVDN